jgi:hypothetical protein
MHPLLAEIYHTRPFICHSMLLLINVFIEDILCRFSIFFLWLLVAALIFVYCFNCVEFRVWGPPFVVGASNSKSNSCRGMSRRDDNSRWHDSSLHHCWLWGVCCSGDKTPWNASFVDTQVLFCISTFKLFPYGQTSAAVLDSAYRVKTTWIEWRVAYSRKWDWPNLCRLVHRTRAWFFRWWIGTIDGHVVECTCERIGRCRCQCCLMSR